MSDLRDAFLVVVLALFASLLILFMFDPTTIGESLRAIDDARFLNLEMDEGLPLE